MDLRLAVGLVVIELERCEDLIGNLAETKRISFPYRAGRSVHAHRPIQPKILDFVVHRHQDFSRDCTIRPPAPDQTDCLTAGVVSDHVYAHYLCDPTASPRDVSLDDEI